MPPPLLFRRETGPARGRCLGGVVQVVVAAATLAIGGVAHADDALSCGASLSAEAAMQRLNDARQRGAACRAGAMSTAAPLTWSEHLAAVAQVQAAEMARLRRISHLDSQNRGLPDRLRALGYRYSLAVENIGVGYSSLDEVVEAWLESEGHCENLMNAAVLEFGVACIDDGAAGAPEERRYWTLVLGAPPRAR